jgi:RNA polymerase sigma-70 factor (ECF subfamily)
MKIGKNEFKNRLLSVQRSLLAFALKLTSDVDAANDLVQDTTLKALNNADKFVANDNFRGWIFTIMRNTFLNNCRSRRVAGFSPEESVELPDSSLFNLESEAPGPDSSYAVREINAIILDLPEGQRRSFTLFLQGYKYEEIAHQMNVPLGLVKSQIFRTRRRLRTLLRDYN